MRIQIILVSPPQITCMSPLCGLYLVADNDPLDSTICWRSSRKIAFDKFLSLGWMDKYIAYFPCDPILILSSLVTAFISLPDICWSLTHYFFLQSIIEYLFVLQSPSQVRSDSESVAVLARSWWLHNIDYGWVFRAVNGRIFKTSRIYSLTTETLHWAILYQWLHQDQNWYVNKLWYIMLSSLYNKRQSS